MYIYHILIHLLMGQTRINNFRMCIERQKTLNSPNNPEKEQNWRHHMLWFQTILQSYSNQNSMILAQKQTHRLIEQNRQPMNLSKLWEILKDREGWHAAIHRVAKSRMWPSNWTHTHRAHKWMHISIGN